MDERDRERQAIDARPEGTGRLRAGVDMAHAGADRVRGAGDRVREAGEDAAWFLRERVAWPAQDGLDGARPAGPDRRLRRRRDRGRRASSRRC